MIIVDSSAIIAILFDEPNGAACTQALEDASARLISAATMSKPGLCLQDASTPEIGQRRWRSSTIF